MIIEKAGAYSGIPNAIYHSPGVTPTPALSASGAKLILDMSPAHYKRKVLDGAREEKREFDIGSASHLLCLEPETFDASISVIEAFTKDGKPSNGYASADAKAQRDAAYAAGKIPLLPNEVAQVRAMREAVFSHPVARHAFVGGTPERSYFWTDPETGIWLKARLDYEPPHGRYIVDLKTSVSANPSDFGWKISDYGYYISAAHYIEAIHAATGERPPGFFFVVVEKTAPFCVLVVEIDPIDLELGLLSMRHAVRTFARCQETGRWPGYAEDKAIRVPIPARRRREIEARLAAGEF